MIPVPSDRGQYEDAGDPDIRQILKALPTKNDIKEMLAQWTGEWKAELIELRSNAQAVNVRVTSLEDTRGLEMARADRMEAQLNSYDRQLNAMQLQMEEYEDRSRRNNVRIKGVPESIGGEVLRTTIVAILNQILGKPPTDHIELDRVHRVPAVSDPLSDRIRDVLCRVHFFTIKDEIVRAAWRQGAIDYEGAKIIIFPDLCRSTLARRGQLKPLLEKIREAGGTYTWGHPLSLHIRLANNSFFLQHPNQLPSLFEFLRCSQVPIPDWTAPRSFGLAMGASGSGVARGQRPRSRGQSTVAGGDSRRTPVA